MRVVTASAPPEKSLGTCTRRWPGVPLQKSQCRSAQVVAPTAGPVTPLSCKQPAWQTRQDPRADAVTRVQAPWLAGPGAVPGSNKSGPAALRARLGTPARAGKSHHPLPLAAHCAAENAGLPCAGKCALGWPPGRESAHVPFIKSRKDSSHGLSDGASRLGDINKSVVWIWGCLGV